MKEPRNVNWRLCLLMSIFFGMLGVDRFMMGHIWLGILKLLLATCGVWWVIDIILIATKYQFKNVNWIT